MSLRLKFAFVIFLVAAGLAYYLIAVLQPERMRSQEERILHDHKLHLMTVGEVLAPLMLQGQLASIHDNLDSLKDRTHGWVRIELLDENSRRLYPLITPGPLDARMPRVLTHLVTLEGIVLGTMKLTVDLDSAMAKQRAQNMELIVVLLVAFVISMGVMYWMVEIFVRRPAAQLIDASAALAEEDYSAQLPTVGSDEFGALSQSFSHMRARLKEDRERLEHVQNELRMSEQRLLWHQENTPLAAISWDRNREITGWNKAAERIFGYTRDDMCGGFGLDRLLAGAEAAQFYKRMVDGDELHVVVTNHTKGGRDIECEWFNTPLYNDKLEHVGVTSLVQDVTEKQEAERALHAAKEDAEQANRAKSDFLSSMSHELRTPMNAILGFAQLLELDLAKDKDSEQYENIRHIAHAGEHLLELIEQVLDLSKIEAGKIALDITEVAPEPLFKECLDLVHSMAERRNVQVEGVTGECPVGVMIGDATRLRQIILNLLSNAVKYNRVGGRVTMGCDVIDGDRLRVKVTDTGFGIPEDRREEVFAPFLRLGAENSDVEGTGIGMTITRDLLALMDGQIDFDSRPGEGSTFWFDIPYRPFEGDVAQAGTSEPSKTPMRVEKDAYLVLYVEDNPANVKLMERVLQRKEGVTLQTTHTAELGLEIAIERHPDVILMDINLPGMNGFEALEKLQAMEETAAIPVIAITANAMPADVARGEAVGFVDYLTKPFRVPDVLRVIERVLETGR